MEVFEEMGEFSLESEIQQFEFTTKNAAQVQRETLHKILEENGQAQYLQSLGLGGRTDPESFKACVPLVTHKDLEPYIHRIIEGDASPILTGKPIMSISLSSGTTQGKPKFVPFNEELMQTTVQIYRTSFAFRNRYAFDLLEDACIMTGSTALIQYLGKGFMKSGLMAIDFGDRLVTWICTLQNTNDEFGREFPIGNGKALQFIYSSKQSFTNGGLVATTATTNVFRSEMFKHTMKDIQSQCCSPDEVIFGPDFHQSLYCHLLCGLIYADEVQFISSIFAHSIVHAFRTLEKIWEELCTDIKEGILSSKITVPSIRAAVSKLLHPNPDLADSIYKKCMGLSNWYGVIPELWPNAKYVYGIMTGSMEPYAKKLRHYAGSLPLVCADYGSSEGWVAANINPKLGPEDAMFAVLPDIGYFEFIPLGEKPEHQQLEKSPSTIHHTELEPVGLTEVEVGKYYEIVITNFAGLYRYRLGDVVKVAGFHNSTPELRFIRRRNLLLTINIDKNTETDLQLAVEEAAELLAVEKLEVVDFTSHVDLSTEPGHYVIFWELNGNADDNVLSSCCNCLDRSFVDGGYVGSRKAHAIGPLELRVVQKGTFHKILDHYLGLGTAVSQFKTPRCVGPCNSQVLQILCNNVIKSYFSSVYS